ncbi:peptidylprolyl isomerase [Candidatus Bathyarchaeota archaeon]|nr:peptidylprolyl isomerase [Candidatus Bathyarchaeota archaeon]
MSNKVHCAHILIEKHSEALQVLNRLSKGENFSAIAKEVSIYSSKKQGGDLGWFDRGQMVKEFEKVAFTLEKGQTTREPVKTQLVIT